MRRMQVGYEKIAIFGQYSISFIWETIQDKAVVVTVERQ